MKKVIFFLAISLILISCDDDESIASYPECLEFRIQQVLDSPPQIPRATIEKYTYKGETVYLFNSFIPDAPQVVYDDSCNIICEFGGLTGNLNDSCPDYWETAIYLETVWKDNR